MKSLIVAAAMAVQFMLPSALAGEACQPAPVVQGGLDPLASMPCLPTFKAEPAAAAADDGYDFATFGRHVSSVPVLTAGIFAGTTVLGVLDWDWGSTNFHLADEGFFGRGTVNGGMDKLGHAYGTYVLADHFTFAIRRRAANPQWAEISGVALALGVMTTVEVLDGFATYGFAWEDMVMNAIGAGFSYMRNTVPGLRDKVDFRLEFIPSGNDEGFKPHSDYSGQKYLLALKLAGFEGMRETPLRFVEIHAGYFARGFTREERLDGANKRREPYIGVGVNLQELLFGWPSVRQTLGGRVGRHALQYIQVPYTYAAQPYD